MPESSGTESHVDHLYGELTSLVELGPRFHGSPGEQAAAEFLRRRLDKLGVSVTTQDVTTTGWHTDGAARVAVLERECQELEAWPMLWSAGSSGPIEGELLPLGRQGLWREAMVWEKFALTRHGTPIAYLVARDSGPAAPQPMPAGSDTALPHLAISHDDGAMLRDLVGSTRQVMVRIDVTADHGQAALGQNLIVDIPAAGAAGDSSVVVCGHYDTFYNTPGAYDNGSGTVVLLDLVRRWLEEPPQRPVRVVFFTAEEWHLAGSRAFVSQLSPDQCDGIRFALNIDGLGRGSFLEYSVGPETFEFMVTDQLRGYARGTGRENLALGARFPPLVGTDDAPFYAAGIPSVHLTFNDFDLLHRPEDLPNRDSATNMAWTVPLMRQLVDNLDPADRAPGIDLL